jgi:hypothetical protein
MKGRARRADDQGEITVEPNEISDLNRPLSHELLARDLTRLAYVAKDGTPAGHPDQVRLERPPGGHVHPEEP